MPPTTREPIPTATAAPPRAAASTPRPCVRLARAVAACGVLSACAGASAPTAPAADAPPDTLPSPTPPAAIRLTPEGESWFDPEVLATGTDGRIAWQTATGAIEVAALDPATGRLVAASVTRVGERAAPLAQTFNGPEFGVDATGWALYFTQVQPDGRSQVARVREVGGAFVTDVLTTGDTHFSPLATKDPSAPTTRLVALRRPPSWGTALWLDVRVPGATMPFATLLDRTDLDARWVDGTTAFVTNNHPWHPGALSLVETATGEVTRIGAPADGAPLGDPYGWRAPEHGSGLLALATDGDRAIAIWEQRGDAWTLRATLTSPVASLPYLGSPEPFVAAGRSYVSVVASSTPSAMPGVSTQEVWILGIDPARPFARRCDDGAAGAVTRSDPETFVGRDEVFVYYYTLSGSRSVTWRCATGIPTR